MMNQAKLEMRVAMAMDSEDLKMRTAAEFKAIDRKMMLRSFLK